MHTLASGPRQRSDAKPAFACPAYALPTAMGYRQASDGSLVKIGVLDEAPTGAEDEDEAEPRPTATAMKRGAAEGDVLALRLGIHAEQGAALEPLSCARSRTT